MFQLLFYYFKIQAEDVFLFIIYRNLSVVLTLDLSKPEEMWYVMETLLKSILKQINNVLSSAHSPELKSYLNDQTKSRIPGDHEVCVSCFSYLFIIF